jgi:hypothetical protein
LEGFKSILQEPPVGLHFQGHPTGVKKFQKPLEGFLQKIQSPTEKAVKIVLRHIIIFFM